MTAELPFNVDCWNTGDKDALRILTHFHGDHIPCELPAKLVVPVEVKTATPIAENNYERYYQQIEKQKGEFIKISEVRKIKHLGDTAVLLKLGFGSSTAMLIGDYDYPEWKELRDNVKNHRPLPDYFIFPIYAKKVSGAKGRLQSKSSDLYRVQRELVDELRKVRDVMGKPKLIGLAHSKEAKKLKGLNTFVSFDERVPSLDDYRYGLIECGSIDVCKGCQRLQNHDRMKG